MNHDDTHLNPEPKPDMQTWIEPELEARIVAWVAGEASAFEVAELERLTAEKPELAIFKRRIEAVHGLVAEASMPDKQPMRLSDERRAKLIASLGGGVAADVPKPEVVTPGRTRSHWSWTPARILYVAGGMAAACMLVLLTVSQSRKYGDREIAAMRAKPDPAWETEAMPQAQDRDLARVRADEMKRRTPAEETAEVMYAPETRVDNVAEPVTRLSRKLLRNEPGLLAQAKSGPMDKPVEGLSLTLGTTMPKQTEGTEFVHGGVTSTVNTPVTVGGSPAAASNVRLAAGERGQTLLAGSTSSGLLLKNSGGAGSVTLGAPANDAGLDRANEANSGVKDRAAAGANPSSGFSFGIASEDGRAAGQASFGRVPPAAGPAVTSTFGETLADSRSGAVAPPPAEVKPATTPPAQGDFITLDAFTVSAPEKKEAQAAGSREHYDNVTQGKVAALEGAKVAKLIAEPKTKGDRAAENRSGQTTSDAETSAAKESVSTFSLHVSDVSFRLAVAAAAAFERGENAQMPAIRAEEFYNAFNYDDPHATVAEKVTARIEQSGHPVLQQRNLLRIAMNVAATGRGAGQPLRLTVLLDTSGSMEREDRRLAVRRALEELIALLGPNDRVTLIGFARQPRLLAESVPGNQAGHLVDLSARTPAEGGTNLEQALKLAGELAVRHRLESGQNRIVLLTDGAANLGNADPAQLATMIETLRQQGIAFDACGIGLEGVGDNVLEALTRKGDGRYYVIDRPESADASFARQLAGAFRPAAENVKLQVRFNPSRVGHYRLIGFDQHRLREEDFRNDKVDAAELAADEGATALYQVEVLPEGSGEIGEVYVRFRDAATGAMVERSWTIRYDAQAPRFDRASSSLQLAGMAALVAEKLGETPLAEQFKLGDFAGVMNALRGHYAHEARVQELVMLYGRLRRMSGE